MKKIRSFNKSAVSGKTRVKQCRQHHTSYDNSVEGSRCRNFNCKKKTKKKRFFLLKFIVEMQDTCVVQGQGATFCSWKLSPQWRSSTHTSQKKKSIPSKPKANPQSDDQNPSPTYSRYTKKKYQHLQKEDKNTHKEPPSLQPKKKCTKKCWILPYTSILTPIYIYITEGTHELLYTTNSWGVPGAAPKAPKKTYSE